MTKRFIAHDPAPARIERAADHAARRRKAKKPSAPDRRPKEIGGPDGPEPTRYGDWERKGICVDF